MNRPARSAGRLATAALASVSLFPVTVISLNLVQRNRYSPTRQAISELALGTAGGLMIPAFCALGIGIFLLAVVVRVTAEKARVTPLLLALASIPAGPISAAFHADRSGARTTLHGTVHQTAGLVAFLLILAAMCTAVYRFRREPWWRTHAVPTAVLAALATVALFLIPAVGNSHFGIAQRLFVGTFVAWLLTTAAYARRRATRHRTDAGHVIASRRTFAGPRSSR